MSKILPVCLAAAVTMIGCATGWRGDAKAIQGKWTPAKAELGGQPMPDGILKTISLKLAEGKYEVLAGGHPDRTSVQLKVALYQ